MEDWCSLPTITKQALLCLFSMWIDIIPFNFVWLAFLGNTNIWKLWRELTFRDYSSCWQTPWRYLLSSKQWDSSLGGGKRCHSTQHFVFLLLLERYNIFYKNDSFNCGISLSNCFWRNLLTNCLTERLRIVMNILDQYECRLGVLFLENLWLLGQYSKNKLHVGFDIVLGYCIMS